jgi:hypothetical protein
MSEEHASYHSREGDTDQYAHYRHELSIKELEKRVDDLDCFKLYASPNIAYIESVIKRNNKRAEFFEKMAYNISGIGVMGLLTGLGALFVSVIWPALMAKFRQYLGGF